ncbi:MAG: hypothetical protein QQW96_01190 [Tychonema bourrellyi B0820]|nr:hypothetical protein [Tychonema bourrellyi B0820]
MGKLAAYSDSNSDHGIIWVVFTQRLSADKVPPKGSSNSDGGLGASSAFLYTIAGGDARFSTYFTCFSCTLLSIARSKTFRDAICDRLFTKPYLVLIVRAIDTRTLPEAWGSGLNRQTAVSE